MSKLFNFTARILFLGSVLTFGHAAASSLERRSTIEDASIEVIQDSLFNKPYVDIEEWREEPIRHLYIHGGFEGSDTRFSLYFPEKAAYTGRFFQYITPVPDNEFLSQNNDGGESDKISFAVSHGGYFIESNGGGTDAGVMAPDPTIGAYRANAAVAQFSKQKATEIYGEHRTYGYAFGGSGGAYRTIGGAENTSGVWDGTVPFVAGSPMAIPNVFTVRMHAMRVLQHKLPQIADALEPGGSGDMYAGLNERESSALKEATEMGFPVQAWFNYEHLGIHAFPAIYGGMRMADATYFNDFWTKSGYLGADFPESLVKDRLQEKSTIKKIISKKAAYEMGIETGNGPGTARGSADLAWQNLDTKADTIPVAFQLTSLLPEVQFLGGELNILSGTQQGKELAIKSIYEDIVVLGQVDPSVSSQLKTGDEIQIDNSNYLAAQTYHRHQVPGDQYTTWDQFKDSDGKPLYPQRPMLIGPLFTRSTVGSIPNGKFNGKMILLGSLWDTEAYPWQSDWYGARVKEQLGDQLDENFRLYFTDHANHADSKNPGDPTHLVSYLGVIQQALLDLSDWVEKGISPPQGTVYEVVDGQVQVPSLASERKGLQPTIVLKANGGEKAVIQVGQEVKFGAFIEIPVGTGSLVSAEWDFEGEGSFDEKLSLNEGKGTTQLNTTHTYTKQGTYFVTLRIASQRNGDSITPYTLIRNLERVRVVVE
ncbi:PKD domain-containing protein [Algoriphagus sp. D3-2-R+10]|uniref:PKD domain-containing protein n=1 Tax=Algoriphagus aurantiacus TaxID=3103948 RepID=UPI002B3D2B92|nr:PKD domain-containing protein [Algoriphagus sp. D3-2-R+10]MEB2774133.1 PKD domain-containing protein [Algoriphagus sp. D3-2-R+10]